MNRSSTEGLKSEALRAALQAALIGPVAKTAQALEQLLAKHSGLPGLRPNQKLAAAFGAEIAQADGQVFALLSRLADDPAKLDSPRVFLPVAAAYGFAQRIRAGLDVEGSWQALQPLAADERSHVRMGVIDALAQLSTREGFADELVARTENWLSDSDRELCYGATATALDVLADGRVLAGLRDPDKLTALLTRVLDTVADAPRSAQRSDGRRRVFKSLGPTLAAVVAAVRQKGMEWFSSECERAKDPELRAALSDALQRMAALSNAPARTVIDELRSALEGSQKPLRDAARVRPGHGRGRKSRPLR
jgi:hypothetical protein